jgi:hypothetical protein
MRLTSVMWVAAYVRRCHSSGAYAVVRRRGAAEAGAIFVILDSLDGNRTLFAPAPQSELDERAPGIDRVFREVLRTDDVLAMEAKLGREMDFDPDLWIVENEDREGRHFLDLVEA